MRVRASVVLAAGTAVLAGSTLAGAATPATAAARHLEATGGTALRVNGEVSSRATYTPAQLAALPQTTFRAGAGQQKATYSGVALATLVQDAGPA
jgi:DMSO/TMAO reductase YedYZ molybdopterin-dependent catalytic subunit